MSDECKINLTNYDIYKRFNNVIMSFFEEITHERNQMYIALEKHDIEKETGATTKEPRKVEPHVFSGQKSTENDTTTIMSMESTTPGAE